MHTLCAFLQGDLEDEQLGIFERGDTAQIATFPGKQLDNPYAGNTVDICPVGALTSKDFRFKIRVWFLKEKSVCPGCARGCNINIHHHNGHVYRLKPRQNDAVNETWICDEGRFSYKAINDNRVLYPHLQQDGRLQQASWPAALERATEAIRAHEGTAVGIVVAPQGTNEDSYLLARLASEVLRMPHMVLYPGVPGYEDDFLIRADKNPNTRGAQDMGLPPATAAQLAAMGGD